MYQIFADDILIYDSTIEDYKIGKGSISLETNKSGSFVFSLYPDHFFYDRFVKLRTVVTVYKSGKIIFRGRVLNDVTDYWNNKVLTCEGELGFLQDSVIRPFTFSGKPETLFRTLIAAHNDQVDEFKRFKVGKVTIANASKSLAWINTAYESTLTNLNNQLIGGTSGGYFYVTHGDDGTDPIPTLNYLGDFTKIASQTVEFGSNLKNYTKTVKADDIATAIIPLGYTIDDGDEETGDPKLTIASVNNGIDYIYDEAAVALYGWIFKTVSWDDVTDPSELKALAESELNRRINQNVTIELTAIDLHLLDHSIESFNAGDYIRVISEPHKFDSTLLCNKQTIDLLKPENDTLTLGYTYSTFTETSQKTFSSISRVVNIQATVNSLTNRVSTLNNTAANAEQNASEALKNYQTVDEELGKVSGDLEVVAGVVTENARNIATNSANIATNSANIAANAQSISDILTRLDKLEGITT